MEIETRELAEELLVQNDVNEGSLGTKLFELYLEVRTLLELKQNIPDRCVKLCSNSFDLNRL